MNRINWHLAAGWIGLAGLVGVWLRDLDALDNWIGLTLSLAFITATFVLFLTRNADEYIAAIWRSGTNLAFLALLAWILLAPAAEGFWDGLTGNEHGMDMPVDLGPMVAFTAFYIGHFIARLRGTAS